MGENINNQNNSVGDKAKPQSEVSPELLAARKAENLKLHKSARVVPVNRQGSSTGSSSGEAVPVAKDTDEKAAGRKHMPPPLPQSGAISAGVGADTVGVSAEEVKKARPSQVQSGHPAGGEGGKQAKKSGATDSAGDAFVVEIALGMLQGSCTIYCYQHLYLLRCYNGSNHLPHLLCHSR